VVSDETVWRLHGAALATSLVAAMPGRRRTVSAPVPVLPSPQALTPQSAISANGFAASPAASQGLGLAQMSADNLGIPAIGSVSLTSATIASNALAQQKGMTLPN
jgi:hypothetical protein